MLVVEVPATVRLLEDDRLVEQPRVALLLVSVTEIVDLPR